jgi:flagellar M-ring protein FliF
MIDSFRNMDGNRRMAALGIAAVLLVGAIFAGKWATTPEYVPLFRDLDLSESGNISDRLTKASIAYKLAAGGTEIDVPSTDAARAKVLLAKDGMPSSGRPGLELFDKPSWGMTDFTQHITYRRALEGELARTIGGLRGVEKAQVHLALSESSPLRRLERSADAAVVLALKSGASLTADQVKGIAQLVSSSVERLPIDHVAVLDDSGNLLSQMESDSAGGMGLSSKQLGLQTEVEKHLMGKIDPLLIAAVGAGQAKVQVTARLNFEQVDRTVEAYDTTGRVLSSEQRSEGGTAEDGAGKAATIFNNAYLNSRKVEKIVGQVGSIQRLTVSVMVNSRALGDGKTVDDARRAQLEELVKNAIGFDAARGDQLAVVAVPFDDKPVPNIKTLTDDAAPKASMLDTAGRFAKPVVAVVAIIAAFVLGLRALKPQGPSNADLALLAASSAAPGAPMMPEGLALRQRLQTESVAQPEASARVVRAWLADPS